MEWDELSTNYLYLTLPSILASCCFLMVHVPIPVVLHISIWNWFLKSAFLIQHEFVSIWAVLVYKN